MYKSIKEVIIDKINESPSRGYTKLKLLKALNVQPEDSRKYKNIIKSLMKKDIIIKDKNKCLRINNKLQLFIGNFYCNPKGYGFVVSKVNKLDLFIPQIGVNHAMHGDKVIAKIVKDRKEGKKDEGEIIDVIKRETEVVIGTYMASDNFGFVIPDNPRINKDIYIAQGLEKKAQSYDKVVCKIIRYPIRDRNPEGEISEVIGFKEDKGVDVLSIVKDNGIKIEFPPKVINQVDKIPEKISEIEIKNRVNLIDTNIFTIDGEDAKDLDDAISIEILSNGNYKLGVHIADVSHYVKEKSKLDKEAFDRGTSVYLIDTVIPMLPKRISNNLCSLNTNSIKLTLSVFMEIGNDGQVVNKEICESYIKSKAQLTYREVTDYLVNNTEEFKDKHPEVSKDLIIMEELALKLMKKRKDRGAIEFDFPECKIELNSEGNVENVCKYERGISNKIIEEFMLVCNETVAEEFYWNKIPFVFRTHENPRIDKLNEFNDFINHYGYDIEIDEDDMIKSKELQVILNNVKGKNEEKAFNLILLRCLQQARYFPNCVGHFGLATSYYCHFTSPIRRYPDLQIHRIIKENIRGNINSIRIDELEKIVQETSKSASKKERIAEKAERELCEIKKIEYMRNKIGETYEGIVTSLNNSGFFVTLDNTVEGYVRIDTLKDDLYEYNKELFMFVGKNTSKTIKIGETIEIVVECVDENIKLIQFKIK